MGGRPFHPEGRFMDTKPRRILCSRGKTTGAGNKRGREAVLRVGRAALAAETATEVAAMSYVARVAGVTLPVAELLGYDLAVRTGCEAWCHGVGAAGHILRGWEAEAGRPASDVFYWDVVAALASPPDMGWFPASMAAQGRPDLTREVMLKRRGAFLDHALGRLAAAG
jgi:hypothetical protein